MSQQGGKPARHEDDWWRQLYDDSTADTGPTAAPDSLDDRYASAKSTVTGGPGEAPGRHDTGPTGQDGDGYDDYDGDGSGGYDGADSGGHDDGGGYDDYDGFGGGDGDGGEDRPGPRGPAVPAQRGAPAPSPAPSAGPPAPEAPADPPRTTGLAQPPQAAAPEPPQATAPAQPPEGAAPVQPSQGADVEPPQAPVPPPQVTAPQPPRAPVPDEPPYVAERHARTETVAPGEPSASEPSAPVPSTPPRSPEPSVASVDYVGSGPPTYDPEPTALPAADPDGLGEQVADTVLDGARYGACTLRAVSLRGDSARYRGEPRRDSLLTARFGSGEQALVLVAMATGARATPGAHLAAAEACRWIGRAVGRSHQRLVEDIRAARRGDLKSGLHRLTDRSLGRLRASALEQGVDPEEYTASLRCLLLPADPDCRTRVFFGVGDGGLFRLRDGAWQDIEPRVSPAEATGAPVAGFGSPPAETSEGDRLTLDLGIPTPPSPYEPAPQPPREPFRFRASVARPGDALVMCTAGLADPLRGEPALCAYLARRWSGRAAPGLAAFLADAQVRVKGYADDRSAAAVWEA
ncbi:protein phosphatase 2C domain-containing protein [Streptomyces sp. NPDC048521]|uniref:protein phosphatase 2C domain-containing protein n=1 Tax=Streptomyces sp. NPDC048521 TaxID=3365566 RepID=UPI0037164B5D